ncbi:MAG: hypothetical protein A3J63_01880 [Candidatus Moranbacteria bacterium RIFCSPHIGHO2_02_FULL_40_12b]|nr:MAG: hypothetical protein A3J63_01880 [Candidatus Moranbacteria bacterium RIFCSPHIGHO2_02_FULL_40_12b]OGI23477.1 MAG: hypothetical protein A3E91_01675 [Candidatus Moranbacteria bacterium RIFCSPHIGHO2_12_FULL_40_10]
MHKIAIEKIKKIFKKFFLINDTPHKIAGGMAVGIFCGIIPGLGIIFTLILSSLFRLNRASALTGFLITNVWLTTFLLYPAAIFGGFIFNEDPGKNILDFREIYRNGFINFLESGIIVKMAFSLLFGFLFVAGFISIAFYFLLYFFLKKKKITLLPEIK